MIPQNIKIAKNSPEEKNNRVPFPYPLAHNVVVFDSYALEIFPRERRTLRTDLETARPGRRR